MRCPHCAGEIPAGSRFCGICGRNIAGGGRLQPAAEEGWDAQAAGPPVESQVDSVSLFELPASRSGRRAKLALILVLDAILAGAGVIMMLSYVESRRDSRRGGPASRAAGERERGKVEVLSPTRVSPRPTSTTPPVSPGDAPATPGVQPATQPPPGEAGGAGSKSRPSPGDKPKSKPKERTGGRSAAERKAAPVRSDGAGMAPEWESGEDADVAAESEGEPSAGEGDDEAGAQIERVTTRLRRVVDGHQADLEECYLAAARSDEPGEPPEGRIDIRFTLMSDGMAANVTPTANTTGSAALAECVADLFRSWKLPGGHPEPLELEWPFLFRAPVETAKH